MPKKKEFLKIIHKKGEKSLVEKSLLSLSKWLHRYHKTRVILLIDEYDAPVHAAYIGKYYDTMINFLRNWLSAGLKDNIYLERAVLTGILRIAKESIFSGLNNISTFTILHDSFSDKFGLLESEVEQLLKNYNLSQNLPDFREWYNGYRIGSSTNIYNPWSVLNSIANKGALEPYWVNTSDNALVKQLIAQASDDLKIDLESLMKGEMIQQEVEEGIVFSMLDNHSTAIWSLLLFSGYLTLGETYSYGKPCLLRIPNKEVRELYRTMILDWFKKSIDQKKYHTLLNSLTSGDVDTFSQLFQEFMLSSVSVFDVPATDSEKIYHGFILGMLVGLSDRYEVKSNRESGLGRYDVMLIPKNPEELGIIMEFKKVGRFEKSSIEAAVESALKQIEERQYAQELIDRGIRRILYLGFGFEGKEVLIRSKMK
ncbi:MAG: PD-(D/E)XK nuclease domain-containing protein [Parachlamydiaceae bacterium]